MRVVLVALGALFLVGCGRDAVVGSKAFTESVIIGEMITQLAEAGGEVVEHKEQLGGSAVLFRGLETGAVDAYPDYTGTLTGELLAKEDLRTEDELRASLRRRGIAMTKPLGFNNGYALGMMRHRAEALGIETLSDLATHPDLTLVFSNEFLERRDGWPAIRSHYGLPQKGVKGMEHALAYRALLDGQIDVTDFYATDAQIAYHDVVILEDDRKVFPRYDAVILYRADLRERHPGLAEALMLLEGRIDREHMVTMNVLAMPENAADRQQESFIAGTFLEEQGLLDLAEPPRPLASRVWLRTRQHLFLVAVSLLIAMAVGVPLGVWAAKSRRAGPAILAGVGTAQTIPALALLLLVFPIFGVGNPPAIAALALYSLLPILRGTHAGLQGIPLPLQEAIEALGLSNRTQLLRVELPLASPSMLSGIKTAAVQNVGFAMLGAFIGAGGYGQPILAGLRTYDFSLIWEGVVPSMVLAFLVHVAFERLDRVLVPRGLRLSRS